MQSGKIRSRFRATEPFNLWKLIHVTDYILQQTVYFRRRALEQVGWLDESLTYGLDWDLLIRLGKRWPLQYIPEYMGCLREYPEAKSFAGGARRWMELSRIASRHGGTEDSPAQWQYGFVTLGDRLPYPLRLLAHLASAHIVRRAQGLGPGGRAERVLHWALPAGRGAVAVRGEGPVKFAVQGVTCDLPAGCFDFRFPADSESDHFEFEVVADRPWRLFGIDWVSEDPIDSFGERTDSGVG